MRPNGDFVCTFAKGLNMARKPDANSVSGYWRAVFKEDPALLDSRSNEDILQRWLADNPGQKTAPETVKKMLAKVKSLLRHKKRKRGQPAAVIVSLVAAEPARISTKGLEQLEEQIDDCLTAARNLDKEGLASVVSLLRRARNEVVWKMGI